MIELYNITKHYDDKCALNRVSFSFDDDTLSAVRGQKGSGKTTLLRIMCGILRPDDGTVIVDERPVWENTVIKKKIFAVFDDPCFLPFATIRGMGRFYGDVYDGYDRELLMTLCDRYGFVYKRRIGRYKPDERKLIALILGVCAHPGYLLIDDIYDALGEDVHHRICDLISFAGAALKMTVITAVTDDEVICKMADRIYELKIDQ